MHPLGVAAGALGVVSAAASFVLTSARFGGTEVTIDGDWVVVEPQGMDRYWTMKRRVRLHRAQLRGVQVKAREQVHAGLPIIGSWTLGWMRAGTFVGREGLSFLNIHRAPKVLVLELSGHTYRKVAVQVAEPFALSDELQSFIARR